MLLFGPGEDLVVAHGLRRGRRVEGLVVAVEDVLGERDYGFSRALVQMPGFAFCVLGLSCDGYS